MRQLPYTDPLLFKDSTIIVQVTDDDIDHGTGRSCSHCAIARALARTFIDNLGCAPSSIYVDAALYIGWAPGYLRVDPFGELPEKDFPEPLNPKGTGPLQTWDNSMADWAMAFDDWEETYHLSTDELRAWHHERGDYEEAEDPNPIYPERPQPFTFHLDLSLFHKPEHSTQ